MAWLSTEGQFDALSSEPVTHLATTGISRRNVNHIITGQTLFHTPTLLGGQAAKAGISCASCHTNGRTNPHFQFPGVSGKPGTADVTHSFFSSHRGDSTFNPVPIPDLTKPGKISHDPESKALEKFIRGLIVEEFDGTEPNQATLNALGAYIRSIALPPGEIQHRKHFSLTIETHLDRTERAVDNALIAIGDADYRLANLLLSGARHQCGLMFERFQGKSREREARVLENLARELGAIQSAIDDGDDNVVPMLDEWILQFSRVRDILSEAAEQSLYNRNMLQEFLTRSTD